MHTGGWLLWPGCQVDVRELCILAEQRAGRQFCVSAGFQLRGAPSRSKLWYDFAVFGGFGVLGLATQILPHRFCPLLLLYLRFFEVLLLLLLKLRWCCYDASLHHDDKPATSVISAILFLITLFALDLHRFIFITIVFISTVIINITLREAVEVLIYIEPP